jgi:hypothetical protein
VACRIGHTEDFSEPVADIIVWQSGKNVICQGEFIEDHTRCRKA